jgi:hypothetical protein
VRARILFTLTFTTSDKTIHIRTSQKITVQVFRQMRAMVFEIKEASFLATISQVACMTHVCVCVYMCICVCVCVHVYIYSEFPRHNQSGGMHDTCICVCGVCMCVCLCVCMTHTCVCVCVHVYMLVFVCDMHDTCMFVCAYMCMHICVYVCLMACHA